MRRFRFIPAAVVAAGAVVWTACGSGADLGIGGVLVVASVEVTPGSVTLIQNQTLPFVASPRTSSGVPVLGRTVAWSSADPGVASVAADGTVSAVAPGTTRITARVDGVSGVADVTVSNVPVDRIDLLPDATAVLIGSTVQLTANLYDPDGGVLTGRPLTWSSSEVLIATVSATGLVTTHGVGQVTITASAEGKTGTATITVNPRPAARLGFLTPPANAVAGATFAPAVRVAIQDATGATVSAAQDSVTLALGSPTPGVTLSGTLRVAAVNGVATFPDLSMTKAGAGYTLRATATGVTDATSATFAVGPAPAVRLDITTQPPSTSAAGEPIAPPPVVQIVDQFANPVSTSGVVVLASLASGSGTLTGTTATTSATGAATFTSLAINGVAGTYTIGFSASGLTTATSTPISLVGGSATRLVFTAAPPTSATNGQAFSGAVTVALQDQAGNPVTQAGVAITAAVGSGAGTLSGPPLTATTDAAGIASFAGLVITGQAGPYTLTFSGSGLSPLTSAPIQLAAGPAAKLVLAVAPPATAIGGTPLVPAPAVQLADASGNPAATSGVQVTATLATGSGTLAGATTGTDAAGRATFSALAISGPAGSYSLAFDAPQLTGVTTGTITLTSGPPTSLTFSVPPPATAVNGQTLNPQPVLQLRDAGGNPVALAGVQVTASVAGPTLAAATITTDANGVAAFTGLALTGLVGNYTLVFTATNVANTASSQITLTAGPATQLTFTTAPPTTAGNGQAFSPAPALQLRDASGNAAAQSGVTVSAAIASGPGGTLSGTLSIATNASGVATFPSLTITGPLGDYTLTFTAAGLTPATSGTVKLVAGPPAGITLTTQPSASARNDEVFPTQPVVVVKDAGGNLLAGVTVLASIGTGPAGTLGGIVSLLTDNSGAASYSDLELVGPVGSYTLQFVAGNVGVSSSAVTLVAGTETRLVITVQPSNVGLLNAISPAPRVELRDSGNNLVPLDGRVVTASIASGNGTLLLPPLSTTSGGVAVFNNIVFLLDGPGNGNHTLQFSSSGIIPAVSVTFRVN